MTPLEALATIQRQLDKSALDEVPEGFKRAAEWSRLWNKSSAQTWRYLRGGVEHGIIECKRFRVSSGAAGIRAEPHYRLIEKKGRK